MICCSWYILTSPTNCYPKFHFLDLLQKENVGSNLDCKLPCKYRFSEFSAKLRLLSSHWSFLAGSVRYWEFWGRWDSSVSVVKRLTSINLLLDVPMFLFSVAFQIMWPMTVSRKSVEIFYKLNYIFKIHWIHSLFKSFMTNEQVIIYFWKAVSGAPFPCLRVSLHMEEGEAPTCSTSLFWPSRCLHSCHGQPVRGAVQNSVGRPPGYRKQLRDSWKCARWKTQWQLWIPSRTQKRSTADTVISSQGLENRKKEVTNVS